MENKQVAELCVADGGRAGQDRLEHRIEFARRAADDLEHLGSRGLMPQGLSQVFGARLHLIEQARILDRDYGLVGEGLQQFDLALRERSGFGAPNHHHADHGIVARHRDCQR